VFTSERSPTTELPGLPQSQRGGTFTGAMPVGFGTSILPFLKIDPKYAPHLYWFVHSHHREKIAKQAN
jgi:hypothetical protein